MNNKLTSIREALRGSLLSESVAKIEEHEGLPGLTLMTGQAYAGKSTIIRDALEHLGVKPGRARDLDIAYAFKTGDGTQFSFVLGGEPEYVASLPETISAIYSELEAGAHVVFVDSLRLLPLFNIRKLEDVGAEEQATAETLSKAYGHFKYSPSNSIWSGGITTNSILAFDMLHHDFLQNHDAYVIAAFNPLLSDGPEYKRLLEGSLAAIETITSTGISYAGRRDIAVPSQGSLRASDSFESHSASLTPLAPEALSDVYLGEE